MRLALISLLALAACKSSVDVGGEPEVPEPVAGIRLEEVASGLQRPLDLASPPDDPRLFVAEQQGRILIVQPGVSTPKVFLDIRSRVGSRSNEQGLLGFAFHPRYASNGTFFVNYTDASGDTRIERYSVSAGDADVADPTSAKLILAFAQPYTNHNGGQLLFGPDGMLYVPTGDGGSGGDPQGYSQDLDTLLGKILRIDVDSGDPYGVPPDNPFVGRADARPEIWALGTRNPWRVAFDAHEGLLYVADVGQSSYEEISVVPADEGGLNFGWNTLEGSHCFQGGSCSPAGLVQPALEYGRGQGVSITGGRVYRGQAIPSLRGRYLYADFGNDWIRSFRYQDGKVVDDGELDVEPLGSISAFGEDGAGELYVISLGGSVFKFVPAS